MKDQLLRIMAAGAVCLVAGAQASEGSSSSGESSWGSRTGRMGHQEVKASQLSGAEVTSSSGQKLGSIDDAIINPSSGRIDFAVLSLKNTSSSTSGGNMGYTTSSKNVAVPWTLLRSSNVGGAAASATTQPSFAFTGDTSKLQSAPAFDPNADLTQSSWRQSIFSYFGVTPGSAAGGGESPGSRSSSSGGVKIPNGP